VYSGRYFPVEAAYYPRGNRGLEARRAADGDRELADEEVRAFPEPRRGQIVAVHPDHRNLGRGISPHHFSLLRGAVGEGDVYLFGGRATRRGDDVIVRDDVAIASVDHTTPQPFALLGPEGCGLNRSHVDLHDRRAHLRRYLRHGLVLGDILRYVGGLLRHVLGSLLRLLVPAERAASREHRQDERQGQHRQKAALRFNLSTSRRSSKRR
jgi:hypothetical protein